MRCPYCDAQGSRVLDSRPANEGRSIRRRRECEHCRRRFTTFETVEENPLYVIKKDGSREVFSRDKLLRGIMKACEKRPIPIEVLESMVDDIQKELSEVVQSEVPSRQIGEKVMTRLYEIDEVAYVRFASVYRQFKDIHMFMEELTEMLRDQQAR